MDASHRFQSNPAPGGDALITSSATFGISQYSSLEDLVVEHFYTHFSSSLPLPPAPISAVFVHYFQISTNFMQDNTNPFPKY